MRVYEMLENGISRILEEIKDVEKELDECEEIVDFGYLLNAVIRDLKLTQKERVIIAKIFWEIQRKREKMEDKR